MGNAPHSLASIASKSCGTEHKLVDKSVYWVNTIFMSLRSLLLSANHTALLKQI